MWNVVRKKNDKAGSVSGFSNIFSAEEATKSHFGSIELLDACLFPRLFCRITFLTKNIYLMLKGITLNFTGTGNPSSIFLHYFLFWRFLLHDLHWLVAFSDVYFLPFGPSGKSQSSVAWVHCSPLCMPGKVWWAFCLEILCSACGAPRGRMNCLQCPGSQVVFFLVLP